MSCTESTVDAILHSFGHNESFVHLPTIFHQASVTAAFSPSPFEKGAELVVERDLKCPRGDCEPFGWSLDKTIHFSISNHFTNIII